MVGQQTTRSDEDEPQGDTPTPEALVHHEKEHMVAERSSATP